MAEMTISYAPIKIEGLAADYPAGERIAPHTHDAHQIVHARTGVLHVASGGDSWFVPPGRAIWMPAGRAHAVRCRTAAAMRTVYIRGPLPARMPDTCAVWAVSPLLRDILVRLAGSPRRTDLEHLSALLFSEIATVATLPLHLPLPDDARLQRLTDAIAVNPADARTLREWARVLGMSERNLIRTFKEETGMTFRQWRRQARLLASIELLTPDRSVTRVAMEVGYDNVSAFVAAFREAFGETPMRYARRTRRDGGEP